MDWGAAAATALAIILLLLKSYQAKAPERKKEDEADKVQEGRNDIAEGNVNAVSARVDQLCSENDSAARLESDEDTERRIAKITGS